MITYTYTGNPDEDGIGKDKEDDAVLLFPIIANKTTNKIITPIKILIMVGLKVILFKKVYGLVISVVVSLEDI